MLLKVNTYTTDFHSIHALALWRIRNEMSRCRNHNFFFSPFSLALPCVLWIVKCIVVEFGFYLSRDDNGDVDDNEEEEEEEELSLWGTLNQNGIDAM